MLAVFFTKKDIDDLERVVKSKFDMKEGPFIKGLEKTLQDLHVHRQAYQGGTFGGNHLHKLLKVIMYSKCVYFCYSVDSVLYTYNSMSCM